MNETRTPPFSESTVVRAYSRIAQEYDSWGWQQFWDENEVPHVMHLVQNAKAKTFVDVGTGTGRYANLLSRHGLRGVAVDPSVEMLRLASDTVPRTCLVAQGTATHVPMRSEAVDVLVAARVLNHVGSALLAFGEFARVVRHRGFLVLTDVDAEHQFERTRVPTCDGPVLIPVKKRPFSELVMLARATGWHLVHSLKIDAANAKWIPPRSVTDSIDPSGHRAIGFVSLFQHIGLDGSTSQRVNLRSGQPCRRREDHGRGWNGSHDGAYD